MSTRSRILSSVAINKDADSTGQLGRPQTRNNVQPARRMSKPGTQLAHRFPRTSRKAADSA